MTKAKEEGVLSMVVTQGLFIMGRLTGGNKICDPRVFQMIEGAMDPEKPEHPKSNPIVPKIQLSALPSAPSVCTVGSEAIRYTVSDKDQNLLALYERVTHPETNTERVPEGGIRLVR